MTIAEKQAKLVAEFEQLPGGWEERYKRIVDRARSLPAMPDQLKTDQRKVRGCSSTVWLYAECRAGRMQYQADSDAVLVRGLIAILLEVYSGERPEEIVATPPAFIERLGLNTNLSPNRANGLVAMVTQIKKQALDAIVAQKRMKETDRPPDPPPSGG
jgi:cysteine desulfuration protein SufE